MDLEFGKSLERDGIWCLEKMVEVGNGTRVLFWKDKWCGSMALCDAFPNLFVVVAHKDTVIKEM